MQTKKQLEYVDTLKGIGILLVVLGHTYSVPVGLKAVIYSFHMPLFFILAGYVYNTKKYDEKSLSEIVTVKFKAYLVPYFLYSFVNLFLVIVWDFIFKRQFIGLDAILHYAKGILYCYADVQHMPNCSPLWFLMCLFWASILLWGIKKYCSKFEMVLQVALLGISFLFSQLVDFRLPWNLATVGAATFFMGVGSLFKKWNFEKSSGLILCGCFGIWAGIMNGRQVGMNENTYGNPLLFLISAITIPLAILIVVKNVIEVRMY